MRNFIIKFLLIMSLPIGSLCANSVDISINNKEAQLGFKINNIGGSEAHLGTYYIKGIDRNQSMWLSLSTIPGNISDSAWLFTAAANIYTAYSDDLSKLATYGLSIGGAVGYRFLTSLPTNLTLEFQYSPDVISFGDANNYYTLEGRFEVFFTPSAIGYLSFRQYRATFNDKNPLLGNRSYFDVTKSIFVGLKIRF